MIRSLKRRLEKLEQRLVSREGPWPPVPGSMTFWIWDAIGRPGERRGYWSMYEDVARQFWKDQR